MSYKRWRDIGRNIMSGWKIAREVDRDDFNFFLVTCNLPRSVLPARVTCLWQRLHRLVSMMNISVLSLIT